MSAAAPAQPLLCAWEEADENTYAKYITSDGEFTELKGPEIAYQNQLDDGVELLADPEHGLMEKKRFETTLGTYHVYFILDQGKGFVVPITDSIPDGLVPKTYIDDDGFVFVLRPVEEASAPCSAPKEDGSGPGSEAAGIQRGRVAG